MGLFFMNKIYILAIIFTLISQSTFAQEAAKDDDWFGAKGRVRIVDRWEERPTGTQHTVRGQFRIDPWVNLDSTGCIKLRGRLSSGDSYNSEWMVSGLADGNTNIDISLRRLYVDIKCLNEKVTLQAGAMPVETEGRLGLTDYGWVDGVRVIIEDKTRVMYLTVGEINDLKTPNLFKRKHTGINYIQAELNQEFGEGHSVLVSLSEYDDTIYSRAGLRYAIQKYISWLDAVAAEVIYSGSNKLGTHLELAFKSTNWNFRLFHANLNPNPSEQDKLNFLVKNFYGYGKNYYFEADRPFGKDKKWVFAIRARDGKAGKLLETGLTRNFGK